MLRDNLLHNEHVEPNSAMLAKLQQALPEYFSSASTFDLEKLTADLRAHNVQELNSGYQLDFIGKDYAKKQVGERPITVIVPDNTHNAAELNAQSENLFFTGDNLEVLRHLQANYQNSIDFIYIDPPYNTGSDGFVYPDKFEYSDDTLKNQFGLDDDGLKRLKSIQGKSTHSAWLTFMYPRLALAKKLLKDSGVIFVSIDDNEQANLKLLMDDLFGEGSFVDQIIWKGKGGGQDSTHFVPVYESIFVYAKNINKFELGIDFIDEDESAYSLFDEQRNLKYKRQLARKWGSNARREDRPNLYFGVTAPDKSIVYPHLPDGTDGRWRHSQARLQLEIEQGDFEFVKDEKTNNWVLYQKIFASRDGRKAKKFTNLIDDIASGSGTKYVQDLFDNKKVFDYPKPVGLVKRFLNMIDNDDIIALDFFAGSATTADAVMQLNVEDGGNRRFIMATLPEPTFTVNAAGQQVPTKGGEVAFDAGFKSIDEISRERIKRAAAKIQAENPNWQGDAGFKHFRMVAPTQKTLDDIDNFDELATTLDLFDDMLTPFSSDALQVSGDATGYDTVLRTYLVADGYKFDVVIENLTVAGYQLPYVDGTRVYIINSGWHITQTKALVNAVGTNELVLQTIVVYGYSLSLEDLRELEIALAQLDSKVNLIVRY